MVQFRYFPNRIVRHDAQSALLVIIDWEGRDDAKCRSHGKRDEQHFTKRQLYQPPQIVLLEPWKYTDHTLAAHACTAGIALQVHAWFDVVKVKKTTELVLINKKKSKYLLSPLQIIRHTPSVSNYKVFWLFQIYCFYCASRHNVY